MKTVVCPVCQGLVNQTAHCSSCGAKLPIITQPMEPPAQTYQEQQPLAVKPMTFDEAQKDNNRMVIGCFALLFLCIALGVGGYFLSNMFSRPTTPTPPPTVGVEGYKGTAPPQVLGMDASVKFNGTQFVITNKNTFDWTDVKMEINGGLFSGGYELKHPTIKAGQTYTVGAMQFADSDGQRFNPFQMKPKKFSICGTTPKGIDCYVGGWE